MKSRNIAKCALCQDIIESTYRHHFITCDCGAISLDGGQDYQRAVGEPDNFMDLTEEELAAWDERPTGRLEEWIFSGGVLFGRIYDDKLKRFYDGAEIRTSCAVSPAKDRKEGRVVETKNSRYLLGNKFKPKKDWTEEEVAEAAELLVNAI